MEPATVIVLLLSAGVFAMLIWFEINSRRNQARMKQGPQPPRSVSALPRESERNSQSEAKDKKAA